MHFRYNGDPFFLGVTIFFTRRKGGVPEGRQHFLKINLFEIDCAICTGPSESAFCTGPSERSITLDHCELGGGGGEAIERL